MLQMNSRGLLVARVFIFLRGPWNKVEAILIHNSVC
jgi:hypothetical protein